jgi:hypothetical protein
MHMQFGDRGILAMIEHALKTNRSAAGITVSTTIYERKNNEHKKEIRL